MSVTKHVSLMEHGDVSYSRGPQPSAAALCAWMRESDVITKLKDISAGKVKSLRHDTYYGAVPPKEKAKLRFMSLGITCLDREQITALQQDMLKMLNVSTSSMFTYTLNVLYPEAVITLIMEKCNVDYEEAQELLYETQSSSNASDLNVESSDDEMMRRVDQFIEESERKQSERNKVNFIKQSKDKERKRKEGPTADSLKKRGIDILKKQKRVINVDSSDSDSDLEDLMEKTKKMQKNKKFKPKAVDSVQIRMYVMTERKTGNFVKDSDYPVTEIPARRSDSYTVLLNRATEAFELCAKKGKVLKLFRAGGALIPNTCALSGKPWTLGSLLGKCRKSPDELKLGVGYVVDKKPRKEIIHNRHEVSESLENEAQFTDNDLKVFYRLKQGDQSTKHEVTIDEICHGDLCPEYKGYTVARIFQNGETLLYPSPVSADQFIVKDGDLFAEELYIVHQSPESVLVKDFVNPVPLLCLANQHSVSMDYHWTCVGDTSEQFASSPVIYVCKPGMYVCEINFGVARATSETITVKLDASSEIPQHDVRVKSKDIVMPSTSYGRFTRQPTVQIDPQVTGMEFKVTDLTKATNDFSKSNVIGRGGYGVVYKGKLRACVDVAIKVLTPEGKNAVTRTKPNAQMQSEIVALTRFRHPNILPLYGYCIKPPALVYEFMCNGSLFDRLHRTSIVSPLSWQQRTVILTDVCRGMVYLHSASPPMVHQDIKSANILLDDRMNAKLADFGFALELPRVSGGRTVFSAVTIARSEGYYPSELTSGHYSDRSDVFSYGIVVLETYTGQQVFKPDRSDKKLIDHLQDEVSSMDGFQSIADPTLSNSESELVSMYFSVFKACTRSHSKRPKSSEVLAMWT